MILTLFVLMHSSERSVIQKSRSLIMVMLAGKHGTLDKIFMGISLEL